MKTFLAHLLVLSLMILLAGCLADADRSQVPNSASDGGSHNGNGDGGGGTLYYWDTDIEPLLTANCGGCHGDIPFNNSVSFTAYANIVDQPSVQDASYLLIDTTNGSSESYVWMKITDAIGITGNPMSYLTPENTTILSSWIDQNPSAPESVQ